MFAALEIENFRGFGKLALEDLGRVNLVVGKNNTGKTSLLEAINLLARPKAIEILPGLFRANAGRVGDRFYGWLVRDGAEAASLAARVEGVERRVVLSTRDASAVGAGNLVQDWDRGPLRMYRSDIFFQPDASLVVHAVSVQHRGPDSMVDAFAEAVRAPADERQMEALLASVDPRIKSVRLDAIEEKPFIVVDIGLSSRVPLSQAGQGIYRLVAIFSELLGSKPRICFIDEIENGIHYSALPAVWRGIAEVAARLDIQIFATTHSRECLIAAHEVFASRPTYDLRVVQLYRIGDAAGGRVLDAAHVQAAIDAEIEVR